MKGSVKADISKMMQGNSAFALQSKLADKEMNVGDCVPAHVYNTAALRQLKARELNTKDKDPIFALKLLKSGQFRGDIQEIGLDPFYVMYCTQLQSQWYDAEFNKKCPGILAVDATGIGLRKVDSCDPKSTLLYTLTAKGKLHSFNCLIPKQFLVFQSLSIYIFFVVIFTANPYQKSLPIAQMISEVQSLHYIRFWLQTCSLNHTKPSEIVMDESSALLGACIQVFTHAKCNIEKNLFSLVA